MRLPRAERRAMRLFYPAVSRFPVAPTGALHRCVL